MTRFAREASIAVALVSLLLTACGGSDDDGPAAPTDVTGGLVAAYTCDGTLEDAVGTADGAASGGFGYAADRRGVAGMACAFDGVDARAAVAATIAPAGSTGYSVSLWMKSGVPSFDGAVLAGPTIFTVWGGVSFTYVSGATATVNGSLTEGTWTHVVATYEVATQSLKLYKDGAFVAGETKGDTGDGLNLPGLDFGQSSWPAATYWTGSLDEVRLYGRALSAAEVTQLYEFQR